MLDIRTATLVKEVLDQEMLPNSVSLEDICKLEPIQIFGKAPGCTILAMQCSDITILVRLQLDKSSGACVRALRIIAW